MAQLGARLMLAHAALVAEAREGRLTLPVLRSDPPILLRPTGNTVHLVGGSAGPLGGDRLRLDVTVRRNACLRLRSAAASVVLPGSTASSLHLAITVESGGHLDWRPEPAVSVAGGSHEQVVDVELHGDATMEWTETVVFGRSGETSGDWSSLMRVVRNGAVAVHQQLRVGPDHLGSDGPAIMDGRRVSATRLIVGSSARPDCVSVSDTGAWTRVGLASDIEQTQVVSDSVADIAAFLDIGRTPAT
jgi:urease accessory protein